MAECVAEMLYSFNFCWIAFESESLGLFCMDFSGNVVCFVSSLPETNFTCVGCILIKFVSEVFAILKVCSAIYICLQSKMASTNTNLRKPVFIKVDQLSPGTSGHNLVVKVISSKIVLEKGRPESSVRQMRIAECLIGDESGIILFTARNEQIDLMKVGATVILRNAKIDMFKGSMRLAVNKWGRIEVTEHAEFAVKEDNNLSLVEYELVDVPDE